MMTAERRRKSGSKGRKLIRVGIGQTDERKLRAKLRGNTGSSEVTIRPGDGRKLPLTDQAGKPRRFLASEAWVDTYFVEVDDIGPKGEPILIKYFDRHVKPPNGMTRCRKCGHATPPQVMEEPVPIWRRPLRRMGMEVLCSIPLASSCSLEQLAKEFKVAVDRVFQELQSLPKRLGIVVDADCISIRKSCRKRVEEATARYWANTREGKIQRIVYRPLCPDCRGEHEHAAHGRSPSAACIQELERRNLKIEEMPLPPDDKATLKRIVKRARTHAYKWKPLSGENGDCTPLPPL